MPAIIAAPECFVIEAVSRGTQDPEDESYIIQVQLKGAYEVRSFLSDNGVNEKRIAFALAELSHKSRVMLTRQP